MMAFGLLVGFHGADQVLGLAVIHVILEVCHSWPTQNIIGT